MHSENEVIFQQISNQNWVQEFMQDFDGYLTSFHQYANEDMACGHIQCKSRTRNVIKCLNVMMALNVDTRRERGIDSKEMIIRTNECLSVIKKLCKVCIFMLLPYLSKHFDHRQHLFRVHLFVAYFESVFTKLCVHSNLLKYCYRKSEIWYWTIHNFLISAISIKSFHDHEAPFDDNIIDHNAQVATSFLVGSILHILDNLELMRTKHWKIAIFKFRFIINLLNVIEMELDFLCRGIRVDGQHQEFLKIVAFLLPCAILNFFNIYKNISKNANNEKVCLMTCQRLTAFMDKYKESEKIFDESVDLNERLSFNMAQHIKGSIRNAPVLYEKIKAKSKTEWKTKMLNQICLWKRCNIKRECCVRFVKCSKCFAAAYCSKKCAKLDWKYGYHKKHCEFYNILATDYVVQKKWMKSTMDLTKLCEEGNIKCQYIGSEVPEIIITFDRQFNK